MTLYDLKLKIEQKEKELNRMRERLQNECTHPKEFLITEHRDNNPDPLQVEVRYKWNKCQLCNTSWRSDEREIRRR